MRDARFARLLWSLIALSCASWSHGVARAQPVIQAGREQEVLALFAPYRLGGELPGGARLMNVAIQQSSITATVEREGHAARLVLLHPQAATSSTSTSLSFSLRIEGDEQARAAALLLMEAVRRNDRLPFWRAGVSSAAPTTQLKVGPADGLAADGALLTLALLLAFLGLRRPGRREPQPLSSWRLVAALAGVTLLGALLRWGLAPQTYLGAWPFSRRVASQDALFDGAGFAWLCDLLGATPNRFGAVSAQTFFFSALAPIAVFAWVRSVFEDRRTGLVAALVVAVLPLHLHFARSEVALVFSVTLSALLLALLWAAIRARTSLGAAAAFISLLWLAPLTFATRPLDLLLAPLAVLAILTLPSLRGPADRRGLAILLITLSATQVFLAHTLVSFGGQVSDGLHLRVLQDALGSLLSDHDTLLNPLVTPTALALLALLGVRALLRHPEERRAGVWLLVWLFAAFTAHAYVQPATVAMQARYHLHLVLPFVALVAAGALWVDGRFPRARVPLGLLILLSPLWASGFIRDVDHDTQRELAFVRRAARRLPEDATVLEYEGGQGMHFGRLFDRLSGGELEPRFRSLPIDPESPTETLSAATRELLTSARPLYFYQGLACLGLQNAPPVRACDALLAAVPLEVVLEETIPHRVYDENIASSVAPEGAIRLRLYRVVPRGAGSSPRARP
ncbi:MAG: hypothetical protein GXP55_20085 [Deltaproteobacteria bacterium]|nr:hypothetical protein [Deltaproteobacteria bacterium]